MIRRPMWLGAGVVLGVGATLWAEQRVKRRVRRAVELLSPVVAGSEALETARAMGGRVRDAVDAARDERRRHETELWHRLGEVPPNRRAHRRASQPPGTRAVPRSWRPTPKGPGGQHR